MVLFCFLNDIAINNYCRVWYNVIFYGTGITCNNNYPSWDMKYGVWNRHRIRICFLHWRNWGDWSVTDPGEDCKGWVQWHKNLICHGYPAICCNLDMEDYREKGLLSEWCLHVYELDWEGWRWEQCINVVTGWEEKQ